MAAFLLHFHLTDSLKSYYHIQSLYMLTSWTRPSSLTRTALPKTLKHNKMRVKWREAVQFSVRMFSTYGLLRSRCTDTRAGGEWWTGSSWTFWSVDLLAVWLTEQTGRCFDIYEQRQNEHLQADLVVFKL